MKSEVIPFDIADATIDIHIIEIRIESRGLRVTFSSNPLKVWKYLPGSYKTTKKRKEHKYKFITNHSPAELLAYLNKLPRIDRTKILDFDIYPYHVSSDRYAARLNRGDMHFQIPTKVKIFPKRAILETYTMPIS